MNIADLNMDMLSEPRAGVLAPVYDRRSLRAGIVHIGVGNFHRAHQATYLDQLFSKGRDHDWAIVGASVREQDAPMRENLAQQDWLSTVVELNPEALSARVNGSMIDFLPIDPEAIFKALVQAEIRIVSLTVTEGGYYIDAATGGFDVDHPDIQRDLKTPHSPKTVFGILLAALVARKDKGIKPFTIVSCDNLPENGRITHQAVFGLAAAQSPELAAWVDEAVAFPNSMVDCITPATSSRERSLVKSEFGIVDAYPVVCEPFRQWVLEDNFSAGRPALEDVGVQFVTDVRAHELMKLRILNGGHAAIAYAAALLGHHFVHDAMADPTIRSYLECLERREIIPTLDPIVGVDYSDYLETILERFSNPRIGDTIPRLCQDGSNRQPKFILPTLEDRLEKGESIDGLALEVAMWCQYCAESDDLNDVQSSRLKAAAEGASRDPQAFLGMSDIIGLVGTNSNFVDQFKIALQAIQSTDPRKTMEAYVVR